MAKLYPKEMSKKEQGNRPKLSDNLEEAAKEFFPDFSDSITYKAAVEFMRDAFIAGADWQKEQMMKDAVEGYVTLTLTGVLTVAATIKEGDNIGISDKVRIIIVKEEG